jgi:alpha-L-fucosidase
MRYKDYDDSRNMMFVKRINVVCLLLLLPAVNGFGQISHYKIPLAPKEYRRPRAYKPVSYRYSLKELEAKFSVKMLHLATDQWVKVQDVNSSGKWKPTRESLEQHQVPEWWKDAKFGMFIDWGPWSVAGWATKKKQGAMYPDWYLSNIYSDSTTVKYNRKNWGNDFQRDDFISLFKAKRYRPDKLVKIAKGAGMKYIALFCKHHGGFCLWPSSYTQRDVVNMGPGKDLVGPLVEACREHGLKFGFYFSIEEWAYPIINDESEVVIRKWGGKTVPYSEKFEKRLSGKIAVRDFSEDYLVPQATEFIDKYDPDILWYDGDWSTSADDLHTYDISAYFYNHAEGRKEVAVNDRYGTLDGESQRSRIGDFYTSEYGDHDKESKQAVHAWEENRGISQSFGFNWQDTKKNVISTKAFVDMFVDIVAHGGNLFLIVNLDGQGALPKIEEERLKDIGRWLKINGDAIYATRRLKVPKDGDDYFTRSKDGRFLYVICTTWPGKALLIKDCSPIPRSKVTMLGIKGDLRWRKKGEGVEITIPNYLQNINKRPCKYAWVIRIPVKL